MKENKPLVSVVIPAYNEERDIEDCLSTMLQQSYSPMEIIVVDDGSTDRTREIVKSFGKIKLIKGEHKGPGASRNLGAKQAKGKIIVLVDADMTFDKDYVKKLTEPIRKGKSIGTEEKYQRAVNLDNKWSKCWGSYEKEMPPNRSEVFRAILKSKFFEMGGFDPKYGYADDRTFFIKYGIKSDLVEGAKCYHKNPQTLKEVFKQSRWIGASLNGWYTRIPLIKYLAPVAMIIAYPIMLPLLSIRKCYRFKTFRLLVPWMLIFMTVRYLGTTEGIVRKVYLGKNVR